MSGLKFFPNRNWPQALFAASAAVLMFSGSLMADTKKPSVSAPAPKAPASKPSAPAAGAHPAGGGAPTHAGAPASPTHAGTPSTTPTHAGTPSTTPTHAGTPSTTPTHAGTPSTTPTHSGTPSSTGAHNTGSTGTGVHNTGTTAGSGRPAPTVSHAGPAHAPSSPGANFHKTASGHEVASHNGHVSEIRSKDMAIRRGPGGMRRTVVERNGRAYSFNRAGYGHVRSSYSYGGHDYAVRRYYVGGAYYPRYYASYAYRGYYFDAYAPAYYYNPYFYGWAYRPWAVPVAFGWGWGGNPWYGYYGGYFTPYPMYAAPNLWLTDYIVAQTLQASYQERIDSARAAQQQVDNNPPPQQAVMTPEIKQMIADEVQRQLAAENAEATARQSARLPEPGAPPAPPAANYTGVGVMLEDQKSHVLLSNTNLDVTTVTGQECSISQGDAIQIAPGLGSQKEK